MNLEHCLIKQIREQQKEAFGVVKERILTTEQCTIYEQLQEQGDCATALGFRRHKIQVRACSRRLAGSHWNGRFHWKRAPNRLLRPSCDFRMGVAAE